MNKLTDEKIILFDGICNLCSGFVQFILKRDPQHKFKFASLQSKFGQEFLLKKGLNNYSFSTFILIEGDNIFTKSTGALRILRQLKGLWPLIYSTIIIPRLVRDIIYDLIARNRYQWFGKKQQCWIPEKQWTDYFYN